MSLISREVAKTRVALALHTLERIRVSAVSELTCGRTIDSGEPFRELKTLADYGITGAAINRFREALARWCPELEGFVRNAPGFPLRPDLQVRDVIDVVNAKLLAHPGPLVCGADHWETKTEEIRNALPQ